MESEPLPTEAVKLHRKAKSEPVKGRRDVRMRGFGFVANSNWIVGFSEPSKIISRSCN